MEAASLKSKKRDVDMVLEDIDNVALETHEMMKTHTTPNELYRMIEIVEGYKHKHRFIAKPNFKYNQIIQYVLLTKIKPIVMSSLYEYAHGSLKDRGTMQSKQVIEKWLRKDPKGTRYCLQMDIHHCYPSIDQERLISMYHDKILDKDFNIENDKSIRACPNGIAPGAPASVYHLHFLLTPFDHWVTEQDGVHHYIRHADDIIIFGSNKKKLHKIEKRIIQYMDYYYNMQINHNHQVFPIEWVDKYGDTHGRPLDTCGFLFYRNRTILREAHLLKIIKKINKISKKQHISFYEAQQFLCQLGWIKHTDTYNVFSERIVTATSVIRLREIVGDHQRRLNALRKEKENHEMEQRKKL